MRVLLVTNDGGIAEKLQRACGHEHQVGTFLTVDGVPKEKIAQDFDCGICEAAAYPLLRPFFQKPLLIVSSTSNVNDWIPKLETGADGVIFRDLVPEAINAQMLAFLRRCQRKIATQRHIARFNLLIDLERYQVQLSGDPLELTLTELKVLKELANDDDRVVPRAQIQQKVFGQLSPGNRSLDVHVCSLRKKLRPYQLDVESVRGVGYRLTPTEKRQSAGNS